MPAPKSSVQAVHADNRDLEQSGRLWRYLTNPKDHPINPDEPEFLACAEALRRAARSVVGAWLEATNRA